jgi:hypothetical protein
MIIVLQESSTGRNLVFQDTKTRKKMTRAKFVKEIEQGNYDDFHVRLINGVKTPCSNPDGKVKNNLG